MQQCFSAPTTDFLAPTGPVWPLEVPLRGAVAHRLRPVGISGLAFWVPGTLIGRPSPNEPAPVVHRASVKGKLAALVPSGPLTVGAVRSGVVEGQGELLAGQPGCATSLCLDVFWRGQAFSDEPSLKAGDGAVL
jgi:hypothetical protein